MDRPLAIGGTSGIISSLVITLLKGLTVDQGLEVPQVHLPPLECPSVINFEEAPWILFVAGFGCGALAGPLLDLLWLLRQRWRRFIWRVVTADQQSGRPLHKVIA